MLKTKLVVAAAIIVFTMASRHFRQPEPDRELAIRATHEVIEALMQRWGGTAEFPTPPASLVLLPAVEGNPPSAEVRGLFVPHTPNEKSIYASSYRCSFCWDGRQRKYGLLTLVIDDIPRIGSFENREPVAYYPH